MVRRKYKSSLKARLRAKKWYRDHPERVKERARIWELKNPEKVKSSRASRRESIKAGQRKCYRARRAYYIEASKKWTKANPVRRRAISNASAKRSYRRKTLKSLRLTEAEVSKMLLHQGNRCAICRGEFGPKGPAIDHCHKTNRVRGVLCTRCNLGLGLFRDSKQLLSSALNYL